MVTYVDPFTPLKVIYPYNQVLHDSKELYVGDPHLTEMGWQRCTCTPLSHLLPFRHPKLTEQQMIDGYAFKVEYRERKQVINNDCIYHRLLYLHQYPILDLMIQEGEGHKVFLGMVFDSNDKLAKTTVLTWNQFLNGYYQHMVDRSRPPEPYKYSIIKKKTRSRVKGQRGNITYYLQNSSTQEEWEFKDGIMIEPIDLFMDWLNL